MKSDVTLPVLSTLPLVVYRIFIAIFNIFLLIREITRVYESDGSVRSRDYESIRECTEDDVFLRKYTQKYESVRKFTEDMCAVY